MLRRLIEMDTGITTSKGWDLKISTPKHENEIYIEDYTITAILRINIAVNHIYTNVLQE